MKKLWKINIVFFIFLMIMSFQNVTYAGYQRIDDIKVNAYINSDGSMNITETINLYTYGTESFTKTFKKIEKEAEIYGDIVDVKVTDISNNNQYEESESNILTDKTYYGFYNENGDFEIRWHIELENNVSQKTFKVEYKVLEFVRDDYKTVHYFYWNFLDDNNVYINKANVEITFENKPIDYNNLELEWTTMTDSGVLYPTISNPNKFNLEVENIYAGNALSVGINAYEELVNGKIKRYASEVRKLFNYAKIKKESLNNQKSIEGTYQQFNNIDYTVQINDDGSMDVTERWDLYVSNTNTLFKVFEKDYYKYSGIADVEIVDLDTNRVLKNINEWQYHVPKNCYFGTENEFGDFEIAWGVGLDSGASYKRYKIKYRVVDAITKYNDCLELYWCFIGNENELSVPKVTGNIYLPKSVENIQDIKAWKHSQTLKGVINVVQGDRIEFELQDVLSENMVEIRVVFPTNIVRKCK